MRRLWPSWSFFSPDRTPALCSWFSVVCFCCVLACVGVSVCRGASAVSVGVSGCFPRYLRVFFRWWASFLGGRHHPAHATVGRRVSSVVFVPLSLGPSSAVRVHPCLIPDFSPVFSGRSLGAGCFPVVVGLLSRRTLCVGGGVQVAWTLVFPSCCPLSSWLWFA